MSVAPVRRKLRTAHRVATRALRRARAAVVDTRVSDADLARAVGCPLAELPSMISTLRRHLMARLPIGPPDVPAILATLDAAAPDEKRALVAAADQALAGTFDLLGSGPITMGDRIDWHRDPISGYQWDTATHFSAISLVPRPGVDVKWPWELSRGQHLPLLAQAALVTGRDAFAERVAADIDDWIARNPPEYGVNWTSAMEAAIRAVNWLWAASLLADHAALPDTFYRNLFASLLSHGRFIAANLEDPSDGIRTNHYIADLVGLHYLALAWPECVDAARWRALAEAGLAEEIESQVLPDGASYESSVPYHRLVAELFLSSALLARRHQRPFGVAFDARLRAMVAFTASYTKPNGLAPAFGDGDDGRLHVLSGHGLASHRDHRHVLALGAHYFDVPEWREAAGPRWTEALWFGAARTPPASASPLVAESAAFRDAGIFVLRHGDDHVAFSAGAVGTRGLGNHKHNDVLSFEAHLAGDDVVVDPGTFEYSRDPDARQSFRSTRAHATVTVDDAEQNRFGRSIFSLQSDAHPRLVEWAPAAHGGGRVTAEHDGFLRLSSPVMHQRSLILGDGHRLRVEDLVWPAGGDPVHDVAWTLTFAAGCDVAASAAGWSVTSAQGRRFEVTTPSDASGHSIAGLSAGIEASWISPSFGVRQASQILRWQWRGALPLSLVFEIRPVD